MTLPVVEDVTTQLFATPATTHNVTQPATVNANDLLIAIFAVDGTANTITWDNSPDTWTNLVANDGFGSQNWSIWYRVADGTEDGETLAIGVSASQDAVSAIVRISGIDTGTAPEVAIGTDTTSATQDPPSISPSWGAADGLVLAVVCSASSIMTAPTYPSGYSNTGYIDGGAAGTVFIAYAAKQITGSSENPGAFTLSASQSGVAYTIAIKGATASATLTDVDTDESVAAGDANLVWTGTGLGSIDGIKITVGTRSVTGSIDSASSTQVVADIPSDSSCFTANIPWSTAGGASLIVTDGGVDQATIAGTFSFSSAYVQHNVTDITDILDPDCIYYNKTPAVAVGDKVAAGATTTLYGWTVTIDDLGYPTVSAGEDKRTDSFAYRIWDATDETWGTSSTYEIHTAPTLTAATGSAASATTASLSVTTDEAEGTIWVVVTTSATTPSHAQIKAGQNHAGAAAVYATSDASVSVPQTFTATGLSQGTTYYAHFTQENAATTPDAATPVSSSAWVSSVSDARTTTGKRIRRFIRPRIPTGV